MELRYDRNLKVPGFGKEAQEKLLKSSVLVIGAGGLGSACIMYLAAAGIGTMGIADNDRVEPTNLNRQVIHYAADLGREKAQSAGAKAKKINPSIKIKQFAVRAEKKNLPGLITDFDFVIDATDNFKSKYLINDACVAYGKPFSHGGALAMQGQAMTYAPGHACLRCLMSEMPKTAPTSVEEGILGAVAGHIGTLQAIEAIKVLTGFGKPLFDRAYFFDGMNSAGRVIEVVKNPSCACGGK